MAKPLLIFIVLFIGLAALEEYRIYRGGLAGVKISVVQRYIKRLKERKSVVLHQSVEELRLLIAKEPTLRYNWEYGIAQCTATLPGETSLSVLELINKALDTPPAFSESDLVGFPINAIVIEFMQTENGRNFFSHDSVNQVFIKILADYNNMIQTPESRLYMTEDEPNGWFSPSAQSAVDYDEYELDRQAPYWGFQNWNEWFLRNFTNIDLTRPLLQGAPNGPSQDDIIINACESTPLSSPGMPVKDVKLTDTFWLKDTPYSLYDMFAEGRYNKGYAQQFVGGTVYQAFLSALFYHRWHAPVDGTVVDIYSIPGTYYLDQSQINPDYDPASPDESQSFLSAVAARQVFIIDADNKKIGRIAIIFIGMAEVSSCVATVEINQRVSRGDEIGHFAFGGSSHTMIFGPNVDLEFDDDLYVTQGGILKGQRQNLRSYLAHVADTTIPEPKKPKGKGNSNDL